MLKAKIAQVVNICTAYPWVVIALAALITIVSGVYSARNFAINTDINKLISPELSWRQRELVFLQAFPQRSETILAVVDAPTSELAAQAAAALVQKISGQTDLFKSVRDPAGGPFFARNALLFSPTEEVAATTKQLMELQPLVQILATDQSLRGLSQGLSLALVGLQRGAYKVDDLARPLDLIATPIENAMAGKPAYFSWRELVSRKPTEPGDLRRFIEIHPVLDYAALEPGKKATDAIRQAAADLKLDTQYFARVRLTGSVPIQDEEFATLKEGAVANTLGTIVVVLFILWLALKSPRIIFAVFLSIFVGLSATAALGLMMVDALNPISVAFAVLFVGIGVDFGIQYSVRYRAERYEIPDLRTALSKAGEHAGVPLTLAAAATAAGFLSFLPTAYRGVAELGQIAGVGMIIAYLTSITFLPALLTILNPPGEKEPLGYKALAPVDRFLSNHRIPILAATAIVSLGGLPLLYFLQFDFNPINLRSPNTESIATYLELRSDPTTGASTIDVLAPNLPAARESAGRLAKVPEVGRVMTLETFIPADQQQKLALIKPAAARLEPALRQNPRAAATDAENTAGLNRAADALDKAAGSQGGAGAAAAKRLAALLAQLAKSDQATREKVQAVFISPLRVTLDGLRAMLQAQPVTEQNLPADIKDDWVKPDGRARVEAHPKGDPNDNETIRSFARAVLAVEPNATGGPISILESGNTVISAFIQAGSWALISIAILLWLTLRRFGDVLLTLVPLLLAGVVTLEICVIIGLPLNFANIIALPLLLGIGVAFKIYYITAWRAGQTDLLQTSLTRAIIYSALTTATAFGSLWLSSHPGTSSMGKLLALSLITTLAAAVLFQPALMGRPREIGDT
jgi:hopanoid biosynthesis associated RND transporter like protein HpnN